MTIILVASVLIISLAVAESFILDDSGLIDYRLLPAQNSTQAILGKDDCGKGNVLVCQDCTSVGLCINDGNDWSLIDAGKCENGETCLEGRCTDEPNPSCSPITSLDFLCTTTGMFPNPADCKRYHICVKDPLDNTLKAFDETCTDNYGYNPKTTFCSKKLRTDGCTFYPVPVCKKVGEIAAVKVNPTLYYVCIKRALPGTNIEVLYPVIYACEHGGTFSRFSGKCRLN